MNKETNIKVGAGVIIVKDGKVLLTKRINSHGEGSFGSLGGHVELGETPINTVKREAIEELGIEIENVEFLTCTNLIKYCKHYIDITFTATIKNGIPTIMENDKIASLDWNDINNLPSPLFEPVRIGLEALVTKQTYFEVNEE